MTDDTDYLKLREKLILYEKNSRTWSGENIMKGATIGMREGCIMQVTRIGAWQVERVLSISTLGMRSLKS